MLGQSNCLNFTAPYITQQGVLLSSWLGILCLISTWTHIQDSQPRQAEGRQNISLGSISNPFKNRRRSEFSRAEGLGAWFPLWPGQGKSSGSITTRTAQAGVTSVCPWYGVWWGLELPVLEINVESKRERGCSFLLLILFLCTTASTHYSYDFTNMHKSDHAPVQWMLCYRVPSLHDGSAHPPRAGCADGSQLTVQSHLLWSPAADGSTCAMPGLHPNLGKPPRAPSAPLGLAEAQLAPLPQVWSWGLIP